MPHTSPLLEMTDIVKVFPACGRSTEVDLDVAPGEVHCLLGQNGAGKSTLIKVLAGAHQPDAGEIRWQRRGGRLRTRRGRCRLGIATIYQELDLVDGLSVAENIFLGHEPPPAASAGAADARRGPRRCSTGSATPRSRRAARSATLSAAGSRSSAWRARCPTTPG